MRGTLLLLLPMAIGAAVMAAGGAPPARWAVHLGIGAIGALSMMAARRLPQLSQRGADALALGALAAVGATLVSGSGIDGVDRWLLLGAFRVHPSALLGPALLLFAATALERSPARAHAILLALAAMHIAQPDAGQATAFGVASVALTLLDARRRALAVLYALLTAAAWLRVDPLAPAPFVEDIVARAFSLSPLVGLAAVFAALASVLSARASHSRGPRARAAELALSAYFAASLTAPVFGAYPVPLLGFGSSPALGAFIGLGLLARARRVRQAPAQSEPAALDHEPSARTALVCQ